MPKAVPLSNRHSDYQDSRSVSVGPRIPVIAFGLSLSVFLALTYVLCVLFDLWFPSYAMNQIWSPLLPGFTWISWQSFGLGLIESIAYGWYVAFIFGPIYNYFAAKTVSKPC